MDKIKNTKGFVLPLPDFSKVRFNGMLSCDYSQQIPEGLAFGDVITITGRLERIKDGSHLSSYPRFWILKQLSQTQGIFLGVRTVSDGQICSTPTIASGLIDEVDYKYKPTKHYKVALVCVAGQNPFYCPFDKIQKI